MCNGESGRTSQGGTIAILKPACRTGRPALKRELSFQLSEDANTGTTNATIDGMMAENGTHEMIIHQDGDLRLAGTVDGSILRRIAIPSDLEAGVPFPLASRLNLGVGGEGIVGRRVSLVTGGTVIGQGVVGYN